MAEITINGTPIAKLRVVDLKNELDARGLSKSGKKDELVARLLSYMEVIISYIYLFVLRGPVSK